MFIAVIYREKQGIDNLGLGLQLFMEVKREIRVLEGFPDSYPLCWVESEQPSHEVHKLSVDMVGRRYNVLHRTHRQSTSCATPPDRHHL